MGKDGNALSHKNARIWEMHALRRSLSNGTSLQVEQSERRERHYRINLSRAMKLAFRLFAYDAAAETAAVVPREASLEAAHGG